MVAKLVLVRHGETETNVGGKLHIAGDPEKLTKKGRDQIKITAKYLCSLNPVKVYCSKEKRATTKNKLINLFINSTASRRRKLELWRKVDPITLRE